MIRTWISAAAAASSLSAGMPSGVAPSFESYQVETPARSAPRSERARILAIAAEVQRLLGRYAEGERVAIVAPRALRDLGLDEPALADVVLGLEASFDIDIADGEAATWTTVGDVVGFVAKRVREAHAAALAESNTPFG
jgi:acyl carrier protein